MLGSAAAATASLRTSTAGATPTSPPRSSRLRGLSYLREYTRDHLSSSSASRTDPPPQSLRRSRSSEGGVAVGTTPSLAPQALPRPAGREHSSARRLREEALEAEGTREETIHNGYRGWVPTVQGRSVAGPLHPSPSTEPASPELDISHTTTGAGVDMTRGRAASAQLGPTPTSPPPQSSSRAGAGNSLPRRSSHAEGMPTSSEPQPTSTSNVAAAATAIKETSSSSLPTIRFIPHIETRSSRPSLNFTTVSRTLPQPSSVVRVGRYSERDSNNTHNNPTNNTLLPVGFKSKVVSRRHCEFWCTKGQWYIRDVKSSSGTFLNHVRLSSPGVESRPYPVNDGDVVQLGIDFKGGEEVIFRCVKIRVECNRGWQKGLNSFNTSAHQRLLKSTGASSGAKPKARHDGDSATSSECSICLNPVAPCQALFVAPCSHVWHYKCIRNLVHGPSWPNFLCPNCRFVADLEADVEAPEDYEGEIREIGEEEEEEEAEGEEEGEEVHTREEAGEDDMGIDPPTGGGSQQQLEADHLRRDIDRQRRVERSSSRRPPQQHIDDEELVGLIGATSLDSRSQHNRTDDTEIDVDRANSASSQPLDIAGGNSNDSRPTADEGEDELSHARSTTPTSSAQFALAAGVMNMDESWRGRGAGTGGEGPRTPRNDAGPFVLDGDGQRRKFSEATV